MARPGVATAILLTFVPMTGEFVVPALLGGDKGVLMGGLIYSQYLGAANYPLGSAMAVLVMAVIGIVLIVFSRLTRGFDQIGCGMSAISMSAAAGAASTRLRRIDWIDSGLWIATGCVFVFLLAPIVTVVAVRVQQG